MSHDAPKYFRSIYYGFTDPDALVCLWWIIEADGRLHVRAELRVQNLTIERICADIATRTRRLRLDPIAYTVADHANVGSELGDGETTSETFRKNKIALRVIQPNAIQGWTRVRELFGVRPDGRPWLTIDPSCVWLKQALTSATQDRGNHADVAPFANVHPLLALRVGAMSRPAPNFATTPPLPPNAVGHLVNELRAIATLARP